MSSTMYNKSFSRYRAERDKKNRKITYDQQLRDLKKDLVTYRIIQEKKHVVRTKIRETAYNAMADPFEVVAQAFLLSAEGTPYDYQYVYNILREFLIFSVAGKKNVVKPAVGRPCFVGTDSVNDDGFTILKKMIVPFLLSGGLRESRGNFRTCKWKNATDTFLRKCLKSERNLLLELTDEDWEMMGDDEKFAGTMLYRRGDLNYLNIQMEKRRRRLKVYPVPCFYPKGTWDYLQDRLSPEILWRECLIQAKRKKAWDGIKYNVEKFFNERQQELDM